MAFLEWRVRTGCDIAFSGKLDQKAEMMVQLDMYTNRVRGDMFQVIPGPL